ncbi:hypothetical protein MKW94_001412 [Papaver nudicaule]|uniref:Ubiquitin fusion degradaton protein n=1 Tax=Papaver nudicaule TaxID=74823 RepID=A0AA41V5X2_PAPNU|nr:hypothetical protein [Papaver nudicaule]
MPPSTLERLASLRIDYPMLFEVRNAATERVSHCGVLEFSAEEGMIYMPYWMIQNMLLEVGGTVRVKNVTLPKGTYVKLQPHTKDFLDISNPKAVLETTLRNFSCLTTGDSIMVAYNNKQYYIDIVESKPANAVSIIDTDCEVDFAPPLDYVEPKRPAPSVPSSKGKAAVSAVQDPQVEEEPKFKPFTGGGRRLDGNTLKNPPSLISCSSSAKDKRPEPSTAGVQNPAASTYQPTSRQPQGKLVFGAAAKPAAPKETPKPAASARGKDAKQEQPEKKEDSKFQAFTGKKYSLMG